MSVALVYSYLENQSYQFEVRGTLPKDRFFYKRQENIAARCNMSKSKIIRCLNVLRERWLYRNKNFPEKVVKTQNITELILIFLKTRIMILIRKQETMKLGWLRSEINT